MKTKAPPIYVQPRPIVELDALDGTETLWEAQDLFKGFCDRSLLKHNLNVPGKPTPKTSVWGGEILVGGKLLEIALGVSEDLNALRMSQAQVKHFALLQASQPYFLEKTVRIMVFTRGDEPVAEDMSNLFFADVGRAGSGLNIFIAESRHTVVLAAKSGHHMFFPQPCQYR